MESTLTSRHPHVASDRFAYPAIGPVLLALVLFAESSLLGDTPSHPGPFPRGHNVVLLLDRNPHQKKVLALEIALAEGIVAKLEQPENVFTVITFGTEAPSLLKSAASAGDVNAAIQDVTVEQTTKKYLSVHFYDALNLAMNQFTGDPGSKSLLVISEGSDYFPHKTFNETVSRARQLQISCYAVMVANHTFYHTKGMQTFGFDLRRLAGKTRGRYIEVGDSQKKTAPVVEHISRAIRSQ
jgi:von Willebrand factor type A domain